MSEIIVTEPTLLAGLSDETYHGGHVRTPGPQTSQSALKLLIEPSTPREFQWRLLNPLEPKRAFDVGRAAHTLVLGAGDPFSACPADLLSIDGRMTTTRAKAWAAEEREAGRTPLTPADYDAVHRMADAVLEHGRAAELFTDPARRPEVSAFCEIAPGLWLRSRFDLLGGELVDFKTAADPHADAFRRSAWAYGYHVQDVAYRRAWTAVTGKQADPMTFVVVGKEPPHLVGIYDLSQEFERAGNDQLDATLATYLLQLDRHGPPDAEGVIWDGLPQETTTLAPPPWVLRDLANTATTEAADWLLSDLEGIMQ